MTSFCKGRHMVETITTVLNCPTLCKPTCKTKVTKTISCFGGEPLLTPFCQDRHSTEDLLETLKYLKGNRMHYYTGDCWSPTLDTLKTLVGLLAAGKIRGNCRSSSIFKHTSEMYGGLITITVEQSTLLSPARNQPRPILHCWIYSTIHHRLDQ